ncbi:MAG: tetratricopeptide repeat protein [Nitrosopumilaceae archaeon]|nr:tetratricopeptide repeat protein [Nitrosopumilaceae archaeon]
MSEAGLGGEALETLDTAIEVVPDIAKCWGMRGDILRELGKYDEALGCYDRAIGLDPYDPRLPEYRDQVLSQSKLPR